MRGDGAGTAVATQRSDPSQLFEKELVPRPGWGSLVGAAGARAAPGPVVLLVGWPHGAGAAGGLWSPRAAHGQGESGSSPSLWTLATGGRRRGCLPTEMS